MAAADGTAPPDLTAAAATGHDEPLLQRLAAAPADFGLFAALRLLEARQPSARRLGERGGGQGDKIRLVQRPGTGFPAAQVRDYRLADGGLHVLEIEAPGLLGPHGPMPPHVTAAVRAAPRLAAFIDMFQHRLLSLFYRAWADAEPAVALDRPGEGAFIAQLAALAGLGPGVAGHWLHHAGLLARAVRHGSGMEGMATALFDAPARLREFAPRRLPVPTSQRWSLGRPGSSRLGRGVLAGAYVFSVQDRVELRIGPLDMAGYRAFFSGGRGRALAAALNAIYLNGAASLGVRPVLAADAVPPWHLGTTKAKAESGASGRIGWDCWLGRPREPGPVAGLSFTADPASSPFNSVL